MTRVQALWRENRGEPSTRAAQLEAVRRTHSGPEVAPSVEIDECQS